MEIKYINATKQSEKYFCFHLNAQRLQRGLAEKDMACRMLCRGRWILSFLFFHGQEMHWF